MKTYLNLTKISAATGMPAHVAASLHTSGRMPDPDVFVGADPGWTLERVESWTSLREPGGTLRTMPVPDPLPGWWEVPGPEYLLCREEVASILGIQPSSVNMYRLRDKGFVRPVCLLGADAYGWDHEQVLTWGELQGYLTSEGVQIPRQPGRRRSWVAAPRL